MNMIIDSDMTKNAPDLPSIPLFSVQFSAFCDAKNFKIE